MSTPAGSPELLSRAALGDEAAFSAVVAPYERSLFRHCYRMLGSGPDAEEALQDTLLRAWRRIATFEASGTLGGWLYRIATNVCLDALRSRRGRLDPVTLGPPSAPGAAPTAPDPELTWVEPVADASLMSSGDPQSEVLRREDISLAFIAALQRLPPRQRACLLLHDVLGFTQGEVAVALDISAASTNSLLYRARQAARPRGPENSLNVSDPRAQDLLERYLEAWHLADIDAFVALVAEDVRRGGSGRELYRAGHLLSGPAVRGSAETRSLQRPSRLRRLPARPRRLACCGGITDCRDRRAGRQSARDRHRLVPEPRARRPLWAARSDRLGRLRRH